MRRPSADQVASFSVASVSASGGFFALPSFELATKMSSSRSKAISGKPVETSSSIFVPAGTSLPTAGTVANTVPAGASSIWRTVVPGTSPASVSAPP